VEEAEWEVVSVDEEAEVDEEVLEIKMLLNLHNFLIWDILMAF
jgi:hypothetical protein